MIFKNIQFLLKKMLKSVFAAFFILSVTLYLISPKYLFSLTIGFVFSFIIFYQFSYTRSSFLIKQDKGMFFLTYVFRLFLYACPLFLGLMYKNYLNFLLILVSLFFFQSYYILIEFFRSLRKVRRQNK